MLQEFFRQMTGFFRQKPKLAAVAKFSGNPATNDRFSPRALKRSTQIAAFHDFSFFRGFIMRTFVPTNIYLT